MLLLLAAPPLLAFPGVVIAKDRAVRHVPTTEVVVLEHRGYVVVTVAADYEGPLTPFAFLLPVPGDVDAGHVETVKRRLISRLEETSAPRFHAFYEKDPCETGASEQSWDERHPARGRGFLTPDWLPPLDRRYAVSNELSLAVEPSFKAKESEFSYELLSGESLERLREALTKREYDVADEALAALAPYVGPQKRLLLARVSLEHVELKGKNRVELGGIRYVSHRPLPPIASTLGTRHSPGVQDLFVYVLDRESRYEAKSYETVLPPSSLVVREGAAARVAGAYNALFDALVARHPRAFVAEYAWPSMGCGEPCPDAPLGLDELLTLGGDVMEARTTTDKERVPPAARETASERRAFDDQLEALAPTERPRARREHAKDRVEIARRRALMARQTYVVSRLHYRYAPDALPRDVTLGPAPPVGGGSGVPSGANGALKGPATPAKDNALEVRFAAFHPFLGPTDCTAPVRFRWGKPWPSAARAARAVPLALDLPEKSRDRALLTDVLELPLPELGADFEKLPSREKAPEPPISSARPAAAAPSGSHAKSRGGCAVVPGASGTSGVPSFLVVLGLLVVCRFWRVRQGRA